MRICIIEYAEHKSDVRIRTRNAFRIAIWILTIFASMHVQLPSSALGFLGPGERYGDDFCTEFFAAVLARWKVYDTDRIHSQEMSRTPEKSIELNLAICMRDILHNGLTAESASHHLRNTIIECTETEKDVRIRIRSWIRIEIVILTLFGCIRTKSEFARKSNFPKE